MSGVPETLGRAVVLFLTPPYLLLLAWILNAVRPGNQLATILAVFIGAATLVAIIAVLNVRWTRSKNRESVTGNQKSRISIATLMLLTIGFSVYMAYISQFVSGVRTASPSLSGVADFLFYCIIFIAITTIVLIQFTHALLAVTKWVSGFFSRSNEE